LPGAVTNVLPKRLQPRQSALVAIGLLGGLAPSQLDHRLALRLLRRHTQAKIVLDVQLKMALDLVVEFTIFALLVEQAANSHHPFTKSFHGLSLFCLNRCSMGKP